MSSPARPLADPAAARGAGLKIKSRALLFRVSLPSFAAGWLGLGAFFHAGAGAVQAQSAPTYRNISVHDPSIIRSDGFAYVFGSHLAGARSADLMSWTSLSGNALVPDPAITFAEAIAWAGKANHRAPDVHQPPDGKFYFYYCVSAGDSPRSALGPAVADAITGPYAHQEILLRSGMWGQTSPDGTLYDAPKHPNAVDPQVFSTRSAVAGWSTAPTPVASSSSGSTSPPAARCRARATAGG